MAFQKGNTFVFGETPSASKWDQLWRNDDALADGSGFDPGAIGTDTLAQSAVVPNTLLAGTGEDWEWQDWTPEYNGFSSNPSGIHQYVIIGKNVILNIRHTSMGTSNATSFTFSIPFRSKAVSSGRWTAPCQVTNNGSIQSGPGLVNIAADATIASVFPTYAGINSFTSSGGKGVNSCVIIYEMA